MEDEGIQVITTRVNSVSFERRTVVNSLRRHGAIHLSRRVS